VVIDAIAECFRRFETVTFNPASADKEKIQLSQQISAHSAHRRNKQPEIPKETFFGTVSISLSGHSTPVNNSVEKLSDIFGAFFLFYNAGRKNRAAIRREAVVKQTENVSQRLVTGLFQIATASRSPLDKMRIGLSGARPTVWLISSQAFPRPSFSSVTVCNSARRSNKS
jgi:hypothetical protein